MKNITIKIALAAGLFVNIASANPIGRIGLDKIVRYFTIEQINALNQELQGLTSYFWAKNKKYAESLLLEVWHPAVKKGVIPTPQEFAELDNCIGKANHGILNLPGEGGHTLLKIAFDLPAYSKEELAKRRSFLKALVDRGAKLNAHDESIMGASEVFKALINVPNETLPETAIKVYKTFLTKNTEAKVWKRFNSFKISGLQAQERLRQVEKARELFSKVEKDLLTQKAEELFSKII